MKLADVVPLYKAKGKIPGNQLQANLITHHDVKNLGKGCVQQSVYVSK